MNVSKLMMIATLAIFGTSFLSEAIASADDFNFELIKNAPVTAEGYSNTDSFGDEGGFVSMDMIPSTGTLTTTTVIAPQDKKSTCPVPSQKKKPHTKPLPKPEPANKADTPNVSHVCTPIININMPQGVFYHPIPNVNDRQTAAISSTTETIDSPPDVPATAPATPTPDSFKFKIKDWVEAEITTQSTTLIFFFIGIFLLFSAIGFCACKAVANQSKNAALPIVVGVVLIVASAISAYWAIRNIAPQRIEDTIIERANAEEDTARADRLIRTDSALDAPVLPLTKAQDATAEAPSQSSSTDRAKPSADNRDAAAERLEPLFFSLTAIILLSSLLVFYSSRTKNRFNSAFPLDEIYHLEDELSKTIAATNNLTKHKLIDLTSLLNSINQARKALETGVPSKKFPKIKSAMFFIEASSEHYSFLNNRLKRLDSFLSAHDKNQQSMWRIEVYQTLTATRQSILDICSIRPLDDNM